MNNKILKKFKAFMGGFLISAILFSNFALFPFNEALATPLETITIGSDTASYGEEISIPVTATNISELGSMTFYIDFNNTFLRYDGFTAMAALNPALESTDITLYDSDTIAVTWFANSPFNASNSVLFKLNFTAISSDDATVNLRFSNDPNPPEISDFSLNVISANYTDGVVTLSTIAGDVIINELFVNPSGDPTGNEWYELLNTTDSDINLSGWTIDRTVTSDSIALSGTLPAHGILVFTKTTGSAANNGGDIVQVKQGSNTSFAMSYGFLTGSTEPHASAPSSDQVIFVSSYASPLVYSTSATDSKGWFNNATDWTCLQLAGTGSPAVPPTLSSVSTCLANENSVLTNMGSSVSVPNPSAATNLYFAKVLAIGGSATDPANIIGKISFAGPLNLTDQETVDYLKVIGNKLDIAGGGSAYAKVGLNTYITGTTESVFKNLPATITMGQLTGLSSEPVLVVKNNSGTVIPSSDGAYPSITAKVFSDTDNTFTFNTDHFTTFETQDTTAPTGTIEYSKDNKASWSSTVKVKSGDTVDIRAVFNENLLDAPVVKLAIDNSLLAAANMTKGVDATHYSYDDVSVGAGNFTANSTFSVGTDSDSNVVTAIPTSGATFVVDNTAPIISETTAVTTPAEDNTPSYTFTTDEAGIITYGGDCSSATTTASVGVNSIVFNALGDGVHSNCTITVTDDLGSASNVLSVTSFTIDSVLPIISETTAVTTPTNDNTPSYSFSSTKAGTISYSGDCSSIATAATVGANAITFSTLSDGTHSNCTIMVTDAVGNPSNVLNVPSFTVDTAVPTNQDTVFTTSIVRQGGASVTVVSAAETGGAIWFAPSGTTTFTAGATMTTASGTATSILTPLTTGDYKLFVIDAAGNVSAASTATLSVDATGPTFTVNEGVSATPVKTDVVNITVSDPNGVNAGTVEYGFSADSTCDGTDTYGNAFTSATDFSIAGNHSDYLCVMAADNGGNASYQLVGQLHTDNTAPTNQDTVFATSLVRQGGASVTVVSAAETGGAIWFAPSGTTTFTAGATMTTASGTATSILAPATEGSYKLFVIDAAGNISSASTAILTVNDTPQTINITDSVSGTPVKTDSITVESTGKVCATTLEYGFSADSTCDVTDTYGNSVLGSGDCVTTRTFSIAGNHNDYLCIKSGDAAGNISYQLVGQLHTDNTAPTNQDTVFATSLVRQGGASVTVVSAAETGGAIWFAPASTTTFTAGATMTTASGTATSILAPATEGSYKLFVIDAAGNVSAASTAILTVNDTPQTINITDSVSGTPVKTDSITVESTGKVCATTLEYGFSADNICNASDTYGNSVFDSAECVTTRTFSIAGNHNDYLCIKSGDAAGNISYQLVG
ncbi:MAG: lamin tail domain-containing protein [Candidatus Pacebacteria bacterium]|nr:lamin tail domain-containing protein [Candidatus Paceibacterota bacterium]